MQSTLSFKSSPRRISALSKGMPSEENEISYDNIAVQSHLIAYIGNKRRLLPLILKAVERVTKGGRLNPRGLFIDYFSGSGVVAKLAKSLGFEVIANDWETYSYVLNRAAIENDREFLERFEQGGRLDAVLELLNSLTEYDPKKAYVSTYYCPQDDQNVDVHRERLFYTRENGILIDNIRFELDQLEKKRIVSKDEKNYLLALLLYEASVRSNTNGVFKAFHRGFGGRKKDALGRICRRLELKKMPLLEGKGKVYQEDALKLAKKLRGRQAEVVYLDPPYNQHQYGSNYHMLNTIAQNDKPPMEKSFFQEGKKIHKSGIRKDWIKTKSSFCLKKQALADFKTLVRSINARTLLISYSTEGIISLNDMLDVLSEKGKLDVVLQPYTRFRGGRQSLKTRKKNVEFVLIVDTSLASTEEDKRRIGDLLLRSELEALCDEMVPVFTRQKELFYEPERGEITIETPQGRYPLSLTPTLQISKEALLSQSGSLEERGAFYQSLKRGIDCGIPEKIENLLRVVEENTPFFDQAKAKKNLSVLFNKVNPKKEREQYLSLREKLRSASSLWEEKESSLHKVLHQKEEIFDNRVA